MIRMDVEFRSNGSAVFTSGEHQAPDAHALARKLVEAGAPDQPIEGGRPGKRDWTARSLHAFAAVTLWEGERGFQTQTYAPYPTRDLHPALQRAISARVERRKNRREARAGTPAPPKPFSALPHG